MPDTDMTDVQNDVQNDDQNDVNSELMNMIIADESPSNISDRIKDMLFAKTAERVDGYRPDVAADTFGDQEAAVAVANAAAEISGEAAAEREAGGETEIDTEDSSTED